MPSLTLGPWKITTIETGFLWLDGGSMFGSVPKPIWSRAHPADDRNRIRLAMRCLLLEGEGRRILVDDGVGDKFTPKMMDIYRVEHDTSSLERSLAALGLGVEDVTDVFLTHLHFDHDRASTAMARRGVRPTLPRARYHGQTKNWDNAQRPNVRERASYLAATFAPLMDAGVVRLWEGPQRPWTGVEVIPAEGHTRGQQLLRIEGREGVLYFVADLIPTA